jgi:dTMP kinase
MVDPLTMAMEPSEPHPFVCIEGIDGVGKSTVSRKLAAALSGTYYKTPPPPYDSMRAIIDQKVGPCARFYFYLSAVSFASVEIGALRRIQPVVCDRYIYSTLAYHITMDECFRGHTLPPSLLMPDATFLLVAGETERLRRLVGRKEELSSHDSTLEANREYLAAVEREFRLFDLEVIDTTNHRADEIVNLILGRVSGKEGES